MKTKLFSVRDLKWETFRCGGKGGQNVNKRDTGARVTHLGSGVTHESREHRTQEQNKKAALEKLATDKRFVVWCKMQYFANQEGYESLQRKLDESLAERNLQIETGVDPGRSDIIAK